MCKGRGAREGPRRWSIKDRSMILPLMIDR